MPCMNCLRPTHDSDYRHLMTWSRDPILESASAGNCTNAMTWLAKVAEAAQKQVMTVFLTRQGVVRTWVDSQTGEGPGPLSYTQEREFGIESTSSGRCLFDSLASNPPVISIVFKSRDGLVQHERTTEASNNCMPDDRSQRRCCVLVPPASDVGLADPSISS